jgi:hypothetical protein
VGKDSKRYAPADLDRVLDGCGFMQHVRDDAAELAEPEWHLAAGVALRCTNGRKRFHELSKPYLQYDEDETDDKLDRAEDAGPARCDTIHAQTGGRYCSSCPFWSGIATPVELGRPHNGKAINTSFGDLPEQAGKGWAAVFEKNVPPTVFRLAEGMARLDRASEGLLIPVIMRADHLTHRVARAAPWVTTMRDGGLRGTVPPIPVVRDMLVQASPPLPVLVGVTQVPVFATTGELQQTPGYSAATKRFYDPGALVTADVPKHPSPSRLRAAIALITEELLGDFPFDGEADKAHALAAALLPFGRDFIAGPTPLHVIDKPIHGTGAGLLAKVLLPRSVHRSRCVLSRCTKRSGGRPSRRR